MTIEELIEDLKLFPLKTIIKVDDNGEFREPFIIHWIMEKSPDGSELKFIVI